MKVKSLNIEKRESYDSEYPNEMVGVVQIIGGSGKMEVKLSSSTVSKIFQLIKEDTQKVADYNSSQVSNAVEEASNQVLLAEEVRSIQ